MEKLFCVGPVTMDPETLEIGSKQLPYFRNDAFSNIMLENEKMLKESVSAPVSSKVVLLTGSGTAGMDAVVSHPLLKEKLLIVNGGTFGARFVEMCDFYNIDYQEIKVDFDDDLTREQLDCFANQGYTGLLINMHETSIGKLYDMEMVSSFCKENNLTLVVDAISAYLCDEIEMDRWGIDCLILSSHKALGLAPGISMLIMSDSFIKNKVNKQKASNYYLDLNKALINMERGQTPFTPAIEVCISMNEKLKRITAKSSIEHCSFLANKFRKDIQKLGFELMPYKMSNALTVLYFPNGGAKRYNQALLNDNICVNPCGGVMADKMLRVSHMGNLNALDFDLLIEKMEKVML